MTCKGSTYFTKLSASNTFNPSLFAGRGPKTIKIFKNQPNAIDFDQAERMEAVEILKYVFKILFRIHTS